jgi:DNA invertase Pin-like site-specific DNA recombinase
MCINLLMKRAKHIPDPPAPDVRLIGYGRVSTNDQNPEMQRLALLNAGVLPDNLHIDDGVSGTKAKRRALSLAFLDLREGDTLLVWKLDRLGRNLLQLIRHAEMIRDVGANLKSLTEPIDTTSPMGKAFFHMIGVFAELERDMISMRTSTRMQQLKAEGKILGRAPKLDEARWAQVEIELRNGGDVEAVAKANKISPSLIHKHFADQGGIRALRALGAVDVETKKTKRKPKN